jgi:Holliday junction resolvase
VSGARHRQKGDRCERELVELHRSLGIHAERYPLSGASRFRGSGHDIDIYAFGKDEAPFVAESKARKNGDGFVTLEGWLSDYDILFLRRNRAEPLVVLPWRVWARLIKR